MKLRSVSGSEVSVASFKGKSPVVLLFFATWCAPSTKAMDSLIASSGQMKAAKVQVIAVATDEKPSAVSSYVARRRPSFPVLLDPGAKTAASHGVKEVPMLFAIDRGGVVRGAYRSFPGAAALLSRVGAVRGPGS